MTTKITKSNLDTNTITEVGTLTSLTVSGNVTLTGIDVSLGDAGNVKITGGTSGQALITDGTGNLTWANASAGTSNARNIINSYVFGS